MSNLFYQLNLDLVHKIIRFKSIIIPNYNIIDIK